MHSKYFILPRFSDDDTARSIYRTLPEKSGDISIIWAVVMALSETHARNLLQEGKVSSDPTTFGVVNGLSQ